LQFPTTLRMLVSDPFWGFVSHFVEYRALLL
jgi:hypothetical protein